MGVPKFFRWCAERYPSVITPFKDSPPPVDNLYLDINGIIHNCTHPNDIDATRRSPTEKEMIQAMFAYLEKLFNAIQPRKHFLLAVDGVAPRAKMNQQRQRRYRAGYEMMVAREEAQKLGEDVPEESDVFDSNCITPGTPFMVRVSKEFQYFITTKLATDPAWQSCKVIFSGHDNPGEGEHKIVDFMRRRKMQPDYDPNETHCMYGLDADLVMLALATHEPHFVLLREVVTFGPGSRKERERLEEDTAKGLVQDKAYHKADEFVLLHVNVLRDYLKLDVQARMKQKASSFRFDFERVVDDFVFMCFFIGNDFLPSVPTVGINDGSMLTMLQLYVDYILSKSMYLTNKGHIDWRATELWLSKLGDLEMETIRTRQQEEAEYQRNRARRDPEHEVPSSTNVVYSGIADYKDRYYRDKHGFDKGWDPTGEEMEALKLHYIEGLAWVIGYYYQGVPSWQWYYPHFYAPMASDLVNLPAIAAKVKFDIGKPFLPHQQLLSVLPPMSYLSMPKAYWPLLKSKSSPLVKFFPEHITIDRDGARAPWEGIVLIPFIDEKVLLSAYKSVQSKVTPEEADNNRLGPALRFSFDPQMTPFTLKDEMFGDLVNVTVKKEEYHFPEIKEFVPRLCDGVLINDNQLEGFSTFQSKRDLILTSYETGVVSIFGGLTKRESLILNLKNFTGSRTAQSVATLLGEEVLVGFPHYKRARIAAVSDATVTLTATYTAEGKFSGSEPKKKNRDESNAFLKEVETHKKYMKAKLGIACEEINILVYVHRFVGMRMNHRGRVVRQFSTTKTCYPIQLVCTLDSIHMRDDSRYVEHDRPAEELSNGAKCVYVGPQPKNWKHGAIYGTCGVVTFGDARNGGDDAKFSISLQVPSPVQLPENLLQFAQRRNWLPLYDVAREVGIESRTLSTICSSMTTPPQFGSRELGLCLKFTGRCLARVGMAKLVQSSLNPWYIGNGSVFARMEQDEENMGYYLEKAEKGDFVGTSSVNRSGSGTWFFSRDAVDLIQDYVKMFEPLIKYLDAGGANSRNLEPQLFMTGKWRDRTAETVIDEIEKWVEATGVMDLPMINATEDAYPNELLSELEDTLGEYNASRKMDVVSLSQVAKSSLYFPITRSSGGHLVPLPLPKEQKFHLGARVVNCRATGMTPFGARGTLVRLLASGREAEVVYDQPFTGGGRLDGRLRETRAAISKLAALLVLQPTESDAPHETAHNGASAANAAAVSVPRPRSAMNEPASATAHISSLTPGGGIDVGSLLTRITSPNSAFPADKASATASATTAAAATATATSTTAAVATQSGAINIPAPRSGHLRQPGAPETATAISHTKDSAATQSPPTTTPLGTSKDGPGKSHRRNVIPPDFMTAKISINRTNASRMFRDWSEALARQAVAKALKDLNASAA